MLLASSRYVSQVFHGSSWFAVEGWEKRDALLFGGFVNALGVWCFHLMDAFADYLCLSLCALCLVPINGKI